MLCYAFSKLLSFPGSCESGTTSMGSAKHSEVSRCACWFYNYALNLQALHASQCEGGEKDLARYKVAARDQKS